MIRTATKTEKPRFSDDPLLAAIGRIALLEDECAALLDGLRLATDQIGQQAARIDQLEKTLRDMRQPGRLMTSEEVGASLGLCQRTLKRWRDELRPRIAFITLEGGDIRYRPEAVEAYLKSRERGVTLKKAA